MFESNVTARTIIDSVKTEVDASYPFSDSWAAAIINEVEQFVYSGIVEDRAAVTVRREDLSQQPFDDGLLYVPLSAIGIERAEDILNISVDGHHELTSMPYELMYMPRAYCVREYVEDYPSESAEPTHLPSQGEATEETAEETTAQTSSEETVEEEGTDDTSSAPAEATSPQGEGNTEAVEEETAEETAEEAAPQSALGEGEGETASPNVDPVGVVYIGIRPGRAREIKVVYRRRPVLKDANNLSLVTIKLPAEYVGMVKDRLLGEAYSAIGAFSESGYHFEEYNNKMQAFVDYAKWTRVTYGVRA